MTITAESIKSMKPEEAVACYEEAKTTAAAQRKIQDMIKDHYRPIVEASQGRLIAYIDAAHIAHGFEVLPTKSKTIAVGKLKDALAKRGIAADEIAAITAESYGNSGGSFGTF